MNIFAPQNYENKTERNAVPDCEAGAALRFCGTYMCCRIRHTAGWARRRSDARTSNKCPAKPGTQAECAQAALRRACPWLVPLQHAQYGSLPSQPGPNARRGRGRLEAQPPPHCGHELSKKRWGAVTRPFSLLSRTNRQAGFSQIK